MRSRMPTKQDVENGVQWLTRAEDQHIRSQISERGPYFTGVRVFVAASLTSRFHITHIRFDDDIFSLVDSMRAKDFCLLLEEVFGVELSDDEHNNANTVGQLVHVFGSRPALA